jgi:predicted DNA-binding transcriptional regulator YafY
MSIDEKSSPTRQALRCARLLREGWHDKPTLARRLGVTDRTVKRYLAAIAIEDDEYETRRVDEIGRREYRIRHRVARHRGSASPYEVMALAIAERFFRAFDPGGVADLLDQVLLDLTGEDEFDEDEDGDDAGRARRAISRRFVLARAPQPLSGRVRLVFDRVLRALVEQRVLLLRYHGRRGERKEYTVRPYTLVLGASELAVTGAVGESDGHAKEGEPIRTFALHRIESIELKKARFRMPPLGQWNPERMYGGAWGLYAGPPEPVEVHIHPGYSPLLADRTWHPSQRVGEPGEDGWVPLRFHVFPGGEFRTWLLGWGPWLRVVEPSSLREWVERMRAAPGPNAQPEPDDLFRIA